MPFFQLPFDPPPLTDLRERLLKQRLERMRGLEKQYSVLQAERTTALSPLEAKLNEQKISNVRDASLRLRDNLTIIKRQRAAETEAEEALRKLNPLERSRLNRGFYRSGIERKEAIEGVLQRERRLNAPLTRDAFDRAKAIAASRLYYDSRSSSVLRGSRGYSYSPGLGDLVDPCVEYKFRQGVRRAVMFAQRSAGRGYRGLRGRSPC
jgi:hypothetical protein